MFIGLALWISLVAATVLGLWLGGSCAMFEVAKQKRPPVMLHVGSVYNPHVASDANWNLLGRVTVPMRPVGVWGDVVYNLGQDEVQSTSFGLFILFPSESMKQEEIDEIEDPFDIQHLPPHR